MTIEIHNPELESILQQQLKAGNFASLEDMLLEIFRGAQLPADEQGKAKALEAAAQPSLYPCHRDAHARIHKTSL